MKKIIIAILVICAGVFLGASQANATVGGPTYVYNLKYNPADTSLYYAEVSQSGRGCPPLLKKLSLTTNETTTVISCDQAEVLPAGGAEAEIRGITESFKDLTLVNLLKNSIEIDVTFVNEEKIAGEDWVSKSNFLAKIYQNDILIAELPIVGCNKEQPFVFGGYAVPGLNKKLILLLSTKGDCWEGGYTYETIHRTDATIIDRTSGSNSYKTQGPLVPSESTLVVYEGELVNNNGKLFTALIAVAILIVGVVVGYRMKK